MRRGQATPGASLIAQSPDDPPVRSAGPHRRPAAALLGTVALFVLGIDQLTKALAVAHLTPGDPRRVLGPVLRFDLTRNSGAAFSTATGMTWVLTVVAASVVIVVIRIAGRMASRSWAVALGLLLGGALGNLTDRLTRSPGFARGEVVDFLEFPHWPIFNLADTSIVCAGVLIVLLSVLGVHTDGRPRGAGPADPQNTSDDA